FAGRLRSGVAGEAALVVETCHRVEAYLTTSGDPVAIAASVGVPDGGRLLLGVDAARHAVVMAVGADSVVVGEDQILHQLRAAVADARAAGALGATLDRLTAV